MMRCAVLWTDIALEILIKDKSIATTTDLNGKTALYELAGKPFAIGSKSQLSVSKRCLNSCKFTSNPNSVFFFLGIILVCWEK